MGIRSQVLGTILVAGVLPAAVAAAQNVVLGRFEVPGLDWGPRAAWRVRAASVSQRRASLLARGDLRALNANQPFLSAVRAATGPTGAGGVAVTGAYFVPVIALAYSDVATPFTVKEYEDVLFSTPPHPQGRPLSLKTYYEQLSGGRITISGRVFDAVRLDTTAAYYQQNCNGLNLAGRPQCPDNGKRFGDMLIAALDSISNRPGLDTTWSRFDNDGPDGLPNSGDDDGEVDFVTFLQPTKDGACGSPGIWAHRYVISVWNGGSTYQTKTPRRNSLGQPIAGQFIRVDNYTIQSQVGGLSACDAPSPGLPASPGQIMSIGIVAHETGHAFGLPDLYDTGLATEGIGEWGIMGSGGYAKAYSPATYDAWSLNELGWATVDSLTSGRTVTTGARQLSDTIFFAKTKQAGEFFLIENRQPVRGDTAFFDPSLPTTGVGGSPCRSRCKKLPGLLIWQIDNAKIAAGRGANRVNVGQPQGVELVQADGRNDLRTQGGNRGDQGDSYPGFTANTSLTRSSLPAPLTHSFEYTGFVVDQIEQLPAGVIRFRFLRREPSVVEASYAPVSVIVNGDRIGRFDEVVAPGVALAINADSVQEVFSGKSRGVFQGWSRGGPRTQTVLSGATPDTVVASYAVQHRALARTSGAGTVTASVAGSPTVGIFLAEGTPVTFTAAPSQGASFLGWGGDTSSANLALTLPMGRAYEVEALFALNLTIPIADATSEILGNPKLSQEQRNFLDQIGNRNGLYDVGDFLALLKRSGQAPSAEILRAIATATKPPQQRSRS